ncbi:MAG: tRNA 2-thiouridine(34) synthase MnmA [Lachnospiraceae bacterium]|nr:tRNA 2-thiouridine(34) synthase MnmA [Lachnospiraceae bacterium]
MDRVVVGLSGGVDSAVAAYLLKKKGYDVIGMTMQICVDPATPWEIEETAAAKHVADHLGIPLLLEDFRSSFRREVEDHFVAEYLRGRTPNPCILCNREIKWKALLHCAEENGAAYVATGHYARVRRCANGRYAAALSGSAAKDQSYVLFLLSQEALARTIFPVGEYEKPEIRRIAEEAGIPAAHTPDSQDICFVSANDYAAYLASRVPERMPGEGNYLSASDGSVVGKHRGYVHYTVGQRKGLGIAAGHPLYVSEIRPESNEVVVSDEDVYGETLLVDGVNEMGLSPDELPEGESLACIGKVRYAHRGTPCRITRNGRDSLRVVFDEPVRAITPGQAAVFYDAQGTVLCGGWIR